MNNTKLSLLSLLLIVACGKGGGTDFQPGHTNDALNEAVQDFEDDFNLKIHFEVAYVEKFSEPQAWGVAGVCYNEGNFKRVEILGNNEDDKPEQLKVMVYHELGHCALGLEHFNADRDIMNANLNTGTIAKSFPFYLDKLKKRIGR